ncbi:MAG: amidohydrolase [Planctomycetota bacterium]|nr:MAG: amidohydrolase [Planctomycetota bacterium]
MSAAAGGPAPTAGVTDVHVHIQPWEQLRPEVRASLGGGRDDLAEIRRFETDPDAFADHLAANGVARAGLVNYPSPEVMGFDRTTNDFVAAYRDARPEVFLAWGGMYPPAEPDPEAEVRRLLDELRLDGIKVHPPHQGFAANAYLDGLDGLRVLYAGCQERGLPVMIHTGTSIFPGARSRLGDPMAVDDVAVDFPELKIVIAHCGRPLWYEQAFFVARRHPNVWLDLSGIPPRQIPQRLPWLPRLADKVLWGTDWPSPGVRNLRANLDAFLALPELDDDLKEAVLVRNPARLFPPR